VQCSASAQRIELSDLAKSIIGRQRIRSPASRCIGCDGVEAIGGHLSIAEGELQWRERSGESAIGRDLRVERGCLARQLRRLAAPNAVVSDDTMAPMFKPEPIPVEVINVLALLGGMHALIDIKVRVSCSIYRKLAKT